MALTKDEIAREDIVLKAQVLFKQYGLKKTTMDEIALACGKAKSTLYHYYKSKGEVFEAVINEEMVTLRKSVIQEVSKKDAIADRMLTYFVSFYEGALNKFNLYRIVKQDMKIETIGQLYFSKFIAFESEYIAKLLTESYELGEFTSIHKSSIPAFSKTLIAAFLGVVRFNIVDKEGIDRQKLEEAVVMLIPKIFS